LAFASIHTDRQPLDKAEKMRLSRSATGLEILYTERLAAKPVISDALSLGPGAYRR
jgi:hypothetical protein